MIPANMFREKCPRCNKGVSKKHDFCPGCGQNMKSSSEDYGFLGKNDFEDLGIKLPFGLKALMKPLMKELTKQMADIDKELRNQNNISKDNRPKNMGNFSIHIGMPGQKPVKLNSNVNPNQNSPTMQMTNPSRKLSLPKIEDKKLEKVKKFPREEPQVSIRRLSDRVIYELDLPEVNSLSNVNIARLEDSVEVKAISKKKVFVKSIDVALPLRSYKFKDEKLTLELGLK